MKLFNWYIFTKSEYENWIDLVVKSDQRARQKNEIIRSLEKDIRILSNKLATSENLCRDHESELMRLGYERVK
jgi:hypothetical protein